MQNDFRSVSVTLAIIFIFILSGCKQKPQEDIMLLIDNHKVFFLPQKVESSFFERLEQAVVRESKTISLVDLNIIMAYYDLCSLKNQKEVDLLVLQKTFKKLDLALNRILKQVKNIKEIDKDKSIEVYMTCSAIRFMFLGLSGVDLKNTGLDLEALRTRLNLLRDRLKALNENYYSKLLLYGFFDERTGSRLPLMQETFVDLENDELKQICLPIFFGNSPLYSKENERYFELREKASEYKDNFMKKPLGKMSDVQKIIYFNFLMSPRI